MRSCRARGSGAEPLVVSCESGCRAFLNPSEVDNVKRVATFSAAWAPRVDNASFCNGQQAGAAYCRVGATKPPYKRKCVRKPVDLLTGHEDLWKAVRPRVAELISASKRLEGAAESGAPS